MKYTKKIITAVTAVGLILALAACDPPKPPELLAQEAEQTHTCIDGTSKVSFDAGLDAIVSGWQDALTAACSGMSFTTVKVGEAADVFVSVDTPDANLCTPLIHAPFAVDAAVALAYFADGTQVQLSAKSIGKILSGQATSWDDPQIAKDNPSLTLSPTPILVAPNADPVVLSSFNAWMKRLDSGFSDTKITAKAGVQLDPTTLTDGEFALTTFSNITTAGATAVSIVAGNDPTKDVVPAAADNIKAAASQYAVTHATTGTEITLDPKIKPTPPLGSDVAPAPYQAVFTLQLTLCGQESLTNRALAKFLLRKDQQGAISGSSYLSLPESLRVEALIDVSKGLPSPSASPKN